jgi:Spy/CpxP family protein refolding chaperone
MNEQVSLPFVCVALTLALGAGTACSKNSSAEGAAPSATESASSAASASPEAIASASAAAAAAAASASARAFAAKAASRHHVGLAGVLLKGAYEFPLNPDQRAALDKAEDQLYADNATSPWTALKSYNGDLVAGIRAGKLDPAKLKTDYDAVDQAVQAGQGREADALNALHATLEAQQRQALAAQVKGRREASMRRMPTAADGGPMDLVKNRLTRLTRQLGLDDAQQKSVGALLAKDTTLTATAVQARRDAAQKQLETLLGEFAKDTFDAKKVDLAQGGAKTPHEQIEHHASFVGQLLPILHPDQREKLAVQTERMANRPGRYFDEMEQGSSAGGPDEPEFPRLR